MRCSPLSLVLLALALPSVVRAQPSPVEIVPLKFWAEETDRFDLFGAAFAAAESLLVVGAYGVDSPGVDGGAVYVFRYTGAGPLAGWEQETELRPSAPFEQSTHLGSAVALLSNSARETFSLAGAPQESLSMFQSEINTGAAYVFRRDATTGRWTREAKLIPEGVEAFDYTGGAVALTANAAGDSVWAAAWSGTAVYLWRREPEAESARWTPEQVLEIGFSLPPTSSANAALAGAAPGPASAARGAALLIGRTLWRRTAEALNASWEAEAVFAGSDPSDPPLGGARALDGDLVLLGAGRVTAQGGAAYLFRYTGEGPFGGWVEEARFPSPVPETFGFGAGGALWAGSDGAGGTGALAVVSTNLEAYLYRNEGSAASPLWELAAELRYLPSQSLGSEAWAVGRQSVVNGYFFDDERGEQAGAGYLFELAAVPPVAAEPGAPASQRGPSLSVYPSPARAGQTVQVRYALAEAGPVRLAVFDVLGRRAAEIADEPEAAGVHDAAWAVPGSLPAGLYVVRLVASGGATVTRKLLIVR